MIKFIDLFCGTGGIRLGMEEAFHSMGIETKCVLSSEIDKNACETYKLNFHEDPYGDVRELDDIKDFDVLLAGFPCQAFSYAGKQLGFADTRGTLFFEVERILRKYRPKIVFLENVRGLTTHDNGRTFKTITGSLNDLGYKVEYRLLNASNYGVPQNRLRIYIFATLDYDPILSLSSDVGAIDSHNFDNYVNQVSLFHDYSHKTVKDILEDNPPEKYNCSEWFVDRLKIALDGDLGKVHGKRLIDTRHGNSIHSWDIGIKGICSTDEKEFMNALISNRRKKIFGTHQDGKALTIDQIKTFYPFPNINEVMDGLLSKGYLSNKNEKYNPVCGNMSFEVFKFLDPSSISITLTASDSNRLGVYHNGRIRRLTPRECARLQGYPDTFILNPVDSFAYKQLGNAVSVPVISTLFKDFLRNNRSFIEGILNERVN